MMTADTNATAEAVALELARKHFNVKTLDVRGRDHLDFHDVSVESIRRALVAAYEAGKAAK
jgi:hypothetical protein